MLITCPTCAAVYRVDDGAIGPAGRNVQCDACGAQWRQEPEAVAAAATIVTEIAHGAEEEAAEAPIEEPTVSDDLSDAAPRKTPGLEEAAELLQEMREESARTDAMAIFGGDDAPARPAAAETPAADVGEAVAAAHVLPSQEELKATIASANKASPNADTTGRGGGFRIGFILALIFVALLAFAYLAKGPLSDQFPAAASALDGYASVVEAIRGMVAGAANDAMEAPATE